MRQRKRLFNPYGLRIRFVLTIVGAAVACILLFFLLYSISDYCLTNYLETSNYESIQIQQQGQSLQNFINANGVSTQNLTLLKKWESRQPVILLELYDGEACIYSSIYDFPNGNYINPGFPEDHTVTISLTDKTVTAALYSDFSYQLYLGATALSFILCMIVFVLIFVHSNQKLISYICRLNAEVQILEGGNLEYAVSVEGNDEITDLAKSMNRMRTSIAQQMETEQQLHEANRQLITQMSHDLRTPLTGILLYLEILRSNRYQTQAELRDYLEKIDAKAHHLKVISDHLFAYASEGTPPRQPEPQSTRQAFEKTANGFLEDLQAQDFHVTERISWSNAFVQVNPEYIQRIFENILSNIMKYAQPKGNVHIETVENARDFCISVMNACGVDGEPVESNGVGMQSIRSMMQQMGGSFYAEQTDTVYIITLVFPKQ